MVDAEINIQQPVQPEALMEEVAEIQPVIEPPAQLVPGQQINYLPLEIPVDELMDDLELQNLQNQEDAQGMVGPNGGNIIINNIHLGMVRIEDNFIQPCLKDNLFPPMPVAMPEIVVPHSKGMLEIPKQWADFFQVLLGSPAHFEWAKKLLQIQFSTMIQQTGDTSSLSLPDNFIGPAK